MSQLIPNTFGLSVQAEQVIAVTSRQQLLQAWQAAQQRQQPALILGGGSNSLFLEDFAGSVIVNRLCGIEITESDDAWLLRVGAGENWHQLVTLTLQKGINGLENLALIPGCVGSAPIQNIGAYGVEFARFADYVELLDLNRGEILTITDGQYGYRESIFKQRYQQGFAVITVGLRLPKLWQPVLNYGDLQQLDRNTVTAQQIYDQVCQTRRSKLPDPAVMGNGGSFFKNPVISQSQAAELQRRYPNMPTYVQADGSVKLAAGWLIDQCGLKGYQIGGAAVHQQQALVLVNQDQAKPQDVAELAAYVRQQVAARFAVELQPEIRFIAAQGEVDATAYLQAIKSI